MWQKFYEERIFRCCDVLSMFVLSKWQCVVLPMHCRAAVCALFYWFHTFFDHTTNISRKVRATRCVSIRWERQTMFKIVTWTKQTWIIHQCTYLGVKCWNTCRACWRRGRASPPPWTCQWARYRTWRGSRGNMRALLGTYLSGIVFNRLGRKYVGVICPLS